MLGAAENSPPTQLSNGFTPPVYDPNPYISMFDVDLPQFHLSRINFLFFINHYHYYNLRF